MRKLGGLFLLGFVCLVLSSVFVSAQSLRFSDIGPSVSLALDRIVDIVSPIFEKIIGENSTRDSEIFFGLFLLLILLIVIVKNILDRTPIGETNSKVSMIISIIVSILAVRFIGSGEYIQAIFLQYGVLGIAITTILPMVIFFYFVHNSKIGPYGRKIFWLLYALLMTAIWISKSGQIDDNLDFVYIIVICVAILLIFLDKNIHGYFGISELKSFQKKESREAIFRAKERMKKLHERLDARIISQYEFDKGIKEEERLIRELSKET